MKTVVAPTRTRAASESALSASDEEEKRPVHCKGCYVELRGIYGPLPVPSYCKDCAASCPECKEAQRKQLERKQSRRPRR